MTSVIRLIQPTYEAGTSLVWEGGKEREKEQEKEGDCELTAGFVSREGELGLIKLCDDGVHVCMQEDKRSGSGSGTLGVEYWVPRIATRA